MVGDKKQAFMLDNKNWWNTKLKIYVKALVCEFVFLERLGGVDDHSLKLLLSKPQIDRLWLEFAIVAVPIYLRRVYVQKLVPPIVILDESEVAMLAIEHK
jgi:hypothetical protein